MAGLDALLQASLMLVQLDDWCFCASSTMKAQQIGAWCTSEWCCVGND